MKAVSLKPSTKPVRTPEALHPQWEWEPGVGVTVSVSSLTGSIPEQTVACLLDTGVSFLWQSNPPEIRVDCLALFRKFYTLF